MALTFWAAIGDILLLIVQRTALGVSYCAPVKLSWIFLVPLAAGWVSEWRAEEILRAKVSKEVEHLPAVYLICWSTSPLTAPACGTQEGSALTTRRPLGTEPCWPHPKWWEREAGGSHWKTERFLIPAFMHLSNLAERERGSKCSPLLPGIGSHLKHIHYGEECCCGRNVKWLRNETCQQYISLSQMTSQGLMLHKPNSRALWKGISLISVEDGFLS